MIWKLMLTSFVCLIGCSQAEQAERKMLQAKENYPTLLQGVSGPSGKLCQQTRNNCTCKKSWDVNTDLQEIRGCGNPGRQAKFPWCIIEEDSCEQPRGIIKDTKNFFDICIPKCASSISPKDETMMGCKCLSEWTYKGKQYNLCQNPDNDVLGRWCFVNETTCKDENLDSLGLLNIGQKQVKWDYCYYNDLPLHRSAKGERCDDRQPESVPLECGYVKEKSQCGNIDYRYCQQSCDRCEICEDETPNLVLNCQEILDLDLCSKTGVEYCRQTCGRCLPLADKVDTNYFTSFLMVDKPELPDSRGPPDGNFVRIVAPKHRR
eukprot:TRINITY_DN3803_c0_g2_i6.p2 TRINITY_DN3803_c0_g2~~TRINITY_DN3803_c0_g2_i6.p2  ORF type:complete len:336 (+),score=23.61 TRINITY_DN3803_c0_g2_i6:50-1009(+)